MKYVSYLNYGGIDLLENMLRSAEKSSMNLDDFYIFCLDEETYQEIKSKGYNNVLHWTTENTISKQYLPVDRRPGDYRNINLLKWDIIEHMFDEHIQGTDETLCYVDVDIVFLKNPQLELLPKTRNYMQSGRSSAVNVIDEFAPYVLRENHLSGGFVVINDNVGTRSLLEYMKTHDRDDGSNINMFLMTSKYAEQYFSVLSGRYYPIYPHYKTMDEDSREGIKLLHMATVKGLKSKIEMFRECNMWFLS